MSEIFAASLMLVITIIGFALIAPSLVLNAKTQASSVISQFQAGELKQGQALSMIYHYESPDAVTLGLLSYGSSPIQVSYVFIFVKGQVVLCSGTDTSSCPTGTTPTNDPILWLVSGSKSTSCDIAAPPAGSSYCSFQPQSTYMLNMTTSQNYLGVPYQVVVYTSGNTAYTFAG